LGDAVEYRPILSGLIGAVIAFFLLRAMLNGGKKKPIVDEAGWTHVSNTPMLIAMGIVFAVAGAACLVLAIAGILNVDSEQRGAMLLLGVSMTSLMAFGTYGIFGVAAKFNTQGILYRRFAKWRFIPWADITKVVDHSGWGTYLRSKSGRLWIWKYRRGFSELLDQLCKHKIDGAQALKESDF